MAFLLKTKPSAEKDLAKLPREARLKIKIAFLDIQSNPFAGKKLQGKYEGFYSIRVWPYRIIYAIQKKELLVFVIKIKHRGGAYD